MINKKFIHVTHYESLLSKKLSSTDLFKGAEVWIDEFTTFTPQQLEIIRILAKQAKRINITLCKEEFIANESEDFTDIFKAINNTENKIVMLMEENNIAYDRPIDLNKKSIKNRFSNNEELGHIEKYFFNFPAYFVCR